MDPLLLTSICTHLRDVALVAPPVLLKINGVLKNKPDPQGQALYDNRVLLTGYVQSYPVNDFFNRFIDLVNFLGTPYDGLADPEQHAQWLIRFNTLFHLTTAHPKLISNNVPPGKVVALFAEIENTSVDTSASFLQYITANGAGSFLRLVETYDAWTGGGRASGDLYLLITLLYTQAVPLDRLLPHTCLDTRRIAALYPPTKKFSGYASWGTGDGGDVPTNVDNHFRKHVLNARPTELDDLDECPIWWHSLGIVLRIDQMNAVPATPSKALAVALFEPSGVLPPARVRTFLGHMRNELMRGDSPLTAWFVTNFKAKYKDSALSFATRLASAAVFLERGSLFVSGSFIEGGGDFYVIGRLDNDVLTISSCYVATNIVAKLAARDVLWTFPA